jgi:cytochrome P450
MSDTVTASLTFMDPGNWHDPYPTYRRLREIDPVQWDAGPRPEGAWVLTRYADIIQALRDPRMSSDRMPTFRMFLRDSDEARAFDDSLSRQMLFLDPPRHTTFRTLTAKAFSPRVVDALRPRIEAIADACLDKVAANGRMDVIADLATPLPVTVIAELLDLPVAQRETLKRWSTDLATFLGNLRGVKRAIQSEGEFRTYLSQLAQERRVQPGSDLLSALLGVEDNGQKLAEADVLATCVLLLFAGHETTTNLIGNGLLALLQNPDQLEILRNEPELLPSAMNELMRYDGTVQMVSRIAKEDVEIAGKRIAAGQVVLCLVAAGNRDPAQFSDPDRVDVRRKDSRQLGFGHGIHFCLGAYLARIEGAAAIGALLRRFPRLRLEPHALEWQPNYALRGLRSLPVRFD